MGCEYKFIKHRPLRDTIKIVTVKRDAAGRLWVCFSVIEKIEVGSETSTGQSGGFDFDLKAFLTSHEGQTIQAPQFFNRDLPSLQTIQRQVSNKVKDSANQRRGKRHIARHHIRIADQRRDFHFQLAHHLCDQYDTLFFEDLNLEGMKRLWGRKVSDLGFAQFLSILKWVTLKRGKCVVLIGRWNRTTGTCSGLWAHPEARIKRSHV
jgi:putative transposase